MSCFRTACLIWMITLISGCATVSITDLSGNTRVEHRFGLISIELAPSTSAVVADAWSFGYASGPMGATLGVGHSRIAAIPEECRLVLWLNYPEQAETLAHQLGDRKDLCIINPLEKENKP